METELVKLGIVSMKPELNAFHNPPTKAIQYSNLSPRQPTKEMSKIWSQLVTVIYRTFYYCDFRPCQEHLFSICYDEHAHADVHGATFVCDGPNRHLVKNQEMLGVAAFPVLNTLDDCDVYPKRRDIVRQGISLFVSLENSRVFSVFKPDVSMSFTKQSLHCKNGVACTFYRYCCW